MYKRYIKKRGKRKGPYYYESVRLNSGRIKSVYLGSDPDSKSFKKKVTLLKTRRNLSKRIKRAGSELDLKVLRRRLRRVGEEIGRSKQGFEIRRAEKPIVKLPEVEIKKVPDFSGGFYITFFVLFGVIIFGLFFSGSYTGFTSVIENITSGLSTVDIISNVNNTTVIEESSVTALVLNVLNYSCIWNGSIFRVCESVEWSGGSYGSGYITGGEAANKAERFTISPFSYCQDVDKEGKKAVNAYILDERERIIKQDLSHDVECVIGNDSVVVLANESIVTNVNVGETNASEVNVSSVTEGNVTAIAEANVSEQNISSLGTNITNATDINISEVNITNLTELNITNISEQNVSVIQYQAVIGKPVKWKKIVKLENETSSLTVELPKEARVITVKKIEGNESIDITSEVVQSSNSVTGLITGLAVLEEPNSTSVIIEENVTEVEIEYETEAPAVYEEYAGDVKKVTVSSETHYENVLTYTSINDSQQDRIRLYWIVNGSRVNHQIIAYNDTNNNSLIDEIYWITPSLSNQTFEVAIIRVSKALHLDANYKFINDVYANVSALDNIWTEPIYTNEYLRVTFEQNLTASKDITVYARNTQNTSTKIEVYHFNSSTKITEFNSITSEGYYKVFLTGMSGSYDTFDLKVVDNNNNSFLEFDYIVDPSPQPGVTSVNINSTDPSVNNTNTNITLTLVNVTAATKNVTNWYLNGQSWTALLMPFENGSNATFTRDYSAFNSNNNSGVNNGTVTSGAVFNASGGIDGFGAYEFDGVNDYIDLGTGSAFNMSRRSFSISLWINKRGNASTFVQIIGRYNGGFDGWGFYTDSNNLVSVRVTNATTLSTATEATSVAINTWVNYVGTYNESLVRLYKNGVLDATSTTSLSGIVTPAGNMLIGRSLSLGDSFNGTIDDVVIYNRSLTAQQINALYLNRTDLIVAQETDVGQNWSACVTPTNTSTEGPTTCSTNFTVLEVGAASCADINTSVTLTQNVTSVGTCYNITADNVVLDCAGFGITYGTVNAGNGVTADNRTNVTVQHCFILDNSSTNSFGIGVNFTRTNLSLIYNNTIDTNGTSDNYGIQIRGLGSSGSYTNRIENNTVRTVGSGANDFGINMITNTRDNNITGNTISTNGTTTNYGIVVQTDASRTIINLNNITTVGSGASNFGIYLLTRVNGTNITENRINTSGTSTNYGIQLDTSANDTIVLNNSVFHGGSTTNNIGIRVVTRSFRNNITHNRITGKGGTNDNYGVDINGVNLTHVEYNNISTNGTTTQNIGIIVETTSGLNNLTNNVIFTNGSSSTLGVYIITNSRHNVVSDNNITTTGTGASNYGIRVTSNSVSTNVTNNVINTSGTGSNFGIQLDNSANDSIVLNNNITTGGSGNSNYGIYVFTNSFRNNATGNRIATSGTATNNDGIRIETDSAINIVDRNNITTTGTGASNFGIYLVTRATANNITNNVVNTSGTDSNFGINLDTSTNSTIVLNNTVNSGGSSLVNIGVRVATTSFFNNITHNRVFSRGTSDNYGIRFVNNADISIAEYNNVTTNGTTSSNVGIKSDTSTGNNITNNLIVTNGTDANYGVQINTDSNRTLVSGNNITTTGTSSNNHGIYLSTRVTSNNVSNNVINTSGTATNFGVNIDSSANETIVLNNSIVSGGSSADNYGIQVITRSFRNNLTHNRVFARGTATNYGMTLQNNADFSTIEYNNITTNGSTSNNNGITVLTSWQNNLTNNLISINGTTGNRGIQIQTDANVTLVSGNNITTTGTSSDNYGVYLLTRSTANNVTNNIINTSGTSTNNGIRLEGSTNDSIILNNNITAGGSTTDNYGIYVFTSSFRNNASRNRIITSGTSSNEGIRVSTDSGTGVVEYNNITTTGTGASNFGIYLVTRATANNVTNNIVNTSGTGSNYGIYLDTSANDTIILNNSINHGGSGVSNRGVRIVTRSFFNNITHNRITGKGGTTDNYGIEFATNANINIIEYNNISTNGSGASNYGIVMQATTAKNNISNNVISTNGTTNNYGIAVQTDASETTVNLNNITTTGSGATNVGIVLLSRVNSTNVSNNIINTSGTTDNYGINLDTSANDSIVLNNSVFSGGSGATNVGIRVTTRSFRNNFTHNRIFARGTSDNYGVGLTTNVEFNTVDRNNLTTNGTSSGNYGVSVQSTAGGNNITNNVIATNGTSSNHGIVMLIDVNTTVIDNNNITTTGSSTSNNGIILDTRIISSNITNNIINTSGTSINYGIRLVTSSNDTIILNNSIASGGSSADNYGISMVGGFRNNVSHNRILSRGTSSNYGVELRSGANNTVMDRNNITTNGTTTANLGIIIASASLGNNITNNRIMTNGSTDNHGIKLENISDGGAINIFNNNNVTVNTAGSFSVRIQAANGTFFNNTYFEDSTNWTSTTRGSNDNNFTNTTFANINGTINFRGLFSFNGTRDITLALLNTTFNRSFVNSSNLTFLNQSATVRLYITGLSSPRIILDTEDDGSYRGCVSSRCTLLSYVVNVLTFNVSSWTSHAGVDNRAPNISRVDINSTNVTSNDTNTNITIYPRNVSDGDADIVKNITSWFMNGSTLMLLNLPFEGGSNSTFTRDYSGNNNSGVSNGSVTSATYNATGGFNGFGAYTFSGATNVINITGSSSRTRPADSFTLTVYINNSNLTGSKAIYCADTGCRFLLRMSGSTPVATINNGSAFSATGSALTAGSYAHIAANYNETGANLSLYINGTISASVAVAAGVSYLSGDALIGRESTADNFFNGTIDELVLYNRSLSPEQIRALYQNRTDLIVGQETQRHENWSACVTPNDGGNASADGSTVCSANFTVLNTAPNVTLVNPPNNTINASASHVFNATLGDMDGLFNATLYHNIQYGSWVANQTISVSGTATTAGFSVGNITPGVYIWNVQACDIDNSCSQAVLNFTFTVGTSCGDNLVTGSEVCDGINLSGNTCLSRNFEAGTLRCREDCSNYDTNDCTDIDFENVFMPERSGSIPPPIVYDADSVDSFDFIANKVILIKLKYKGKMYDVNVDDLQTDHAVLKITASPARYYKFKNAENKLMDLDEDGRIDFYFVYDTRLTERAGFHVERYGVEERAKEEVKEPEIEEVKIERPREVKRYEEFTLGDVLLLVFSVLILMLFVLVIFRFMIRSVEKPRKRR